MRFGAVIVSDDSDLAELVEGNHQYNVSTPAGVDSLISDSVEAFGRVAIVVNNAAVSAHHRPFFKIKLE
jgi:NAD(P)-dependent dehydrogenase (short-subunit alcohol dehydrogenase family)